MATASKKTVSVRLEARYRLIVRTSFKGSPTARYTSAITAALSNYEVKKEKNTATYESQSMLLRDATDALIDMMATFKKYDRIPLDSIWIYLSLSPDSPPV